MTLPVVSVQSKPILIAVVGPTAVGKTAVAQRIAEQYNGEIITADSRTIYRGLDIGTAKPTFSRGEAATCGCDHFFGSVRHHLINIINPDERFSVVEFQTRAERCLAVILEQKKTPIVCGGTGLYVSSLIDPVSFSLLETAPELRVMLEQKPLPELIALLETKDPATASKVDLKNPRRVVRALEIILATHKPRQPLAKRELPFIPCMIGLSLPLTTLRERIAERIETQLKLGLEKEAFVLSERYGWDAPALSAIGYREWRPYATGEVTRTEVIARLQIDTRQYAKRQDTWFKRDKRIQWFLPSAEQALRTTIDSTVKSLKKIS